jgi:hypothetical protein
VTASAFNPTAIALISSLAGTQLAAANGAPAGALAYFFGFSSGVFSWFLLLSLLLAGLRRRLPAATVRLAARVTGLLLIVLAIWSAISVFRAAT